MIHWELSMKSVTKGTTGARDIRINQQWTANLPDGIAFEPGSVEAWGPAGGTTKVQKHVLDETQVSVKSASSTQGDTD
jgi:hypothetical protein